MNKRYTLEAAEKLRESRAAARCSPGRPATSYFPISYAERLAGEDPERPHRPDPRREDLRAARPAAAPGRRDRRRSSRQIEAKRATARSFSLLACFSSDRGAIFRVTMTPTGRRAMPKKIFDQDRPRSTMARRLDEAFAGCEQWTARAADSAAQRASTSARSPRSHRGSAAAPRRCAPRSPARCSSRRRAGARCRRPARRCWRDARSTRRVARRVQSLPPARPQHRPPAAAAHRPQADGAEDPVGRAVVGDRLRRRPPRSPPGHAQRPRAAARGPSRSWLRWRWQCSSTPVPGGDDLRDQRRRGAPPARRRGRRSPWRPASRSVSRTAGVPCGWGPSSKVRATPPALASWRSRPEGRADAGNDRRQRRARRGATARGTDGAAAGARSRSAVRGRLGWLRPAAADAARRAARRAKPRSPCRCGCGRSSGLAITL